MRPLTTLAMLALGAAFVASAHAQEPPRSNLLLEMSRPQSMPVDSSMREDIQARPAGPRAPDPFGDSFRVSVGVGDPRCFPGEDGLFFPERLPSGARRRMR